MTPITKLVQGIVKVRHHTKFRLNTLNGSTVTVLSHTHTHTDRTDSVTSTAYMAGNDGAVLIFVFITDCVHIKLQHIVLYDIVLFFSIFRAKFQQFVAIMATKFDYRLDDISMATSY